MVNPRSPWSVSPKMAAVLCTIGVSAPGSALLASIHFGWPEPWAPVTLAGPLLSVLVTTQTRCSRRQRLAGLALIPVATVILFGIALLVAGWTGPQGVAVADWRSVV